MKRQIQLGLFSFALAFSATSAYAATTTGSFDVSATVSDSCSVSATNLAFGNVDPLSTTPTQATSAIEVTCSNNTTYDVGLGAGSNSTDVTARKLSDGAATPNLLNYALYTDSARTTNWGNTVGTDTVSATGTGSAQTHTVYGEVPESQNSAPIGTYTDTINITVSY